ncbi:L-seryl-tRNA(Sec) selenium transferase SelA [Peptoclostridium acidaminophilum DSM 3953]|uniref:L-seryl-tRNA(Sec) selenium transferase n=1 Tax=Peptoclostridium acidaminophilum DSM 3953 TaxID=1286171 RepID=W8TF72_PEPAC|nr:L-seryl-tRNA(Sec) selenium transferase [Peptoclostridium acidaminophilum]AHM56478.1 L-seryl-tRNA(Sec) selenium transferase SelA [Peptoclostridium acidaminophilum DSM 3953]
MDKRTLFSKLPSVDKILGNDGVIELEKEYPRSLIVEVIREQIELARKRILELNESDMEGFDIDEDILINDIGHQLKLKYALKLKRLINATGVVVHTNLGRSPMAEEIKEDLWLIASRYSNLEYDIESGKRGSRYSHLEEIVRKITGAEDVLVVNNNAAAVMLVLGTMAQGKEVITSRGELVEIGGSFRIPSVMEQSGAKLVEVGTTNKTYASDYEAAITENTGALLKVHTSNFRVVGFTNTPELEELREIGDKYDIPVIEDLGSGVFIDLSKYGLSYEPTVMDSLRKGADIVTFSGDKILGGPQAGIIVGKKKYIDKMKKNQLTRALRVDKFIICALEATMRYYIEEEIAIKKIPTLRMLTYKLDEIKEKAQRLNEMIGRLGIPAEVKIEVGHSQVGGGSLPLERIESRVISIVPENMSVSRLEESLRLCDDHIIGRVYDEKYVIDVRTLFDEEYEIICNQLKSILG